MPEVVRRLTDRTHHLKRVGGIDFIETREVENFVISIVKGGT